MSRHQRQRDELRGLCGSGAVVRAIDLAFAHFADFGRDEEVVTLISVAIERHGVAPDLQRRFEELTSMADPTG